MRILIVEDEASIAEHIAWMCNKVLGKKLARCEIRTSFDEAVAYMDRNPIELLLLDLNLNGKNGFDILGRAAAESFDTIIISAHTEQAITAFQYGVLDFIPKPFDEERLRMAFERIHGRRPNQIEARFLSVRVGNAVSLLPVESIVYLKASGNYTEVFLRNGRMELLSKTLERTERILPARFLRIHRSYLVDFNQIEQYNHVGGGVYEVRLKNGSRLPLSRTKYKILKEKTLR